MRTACIALLLAALAAGAAHAEIYAWRDASGAKRMSNIPPPWFNETGPSRPRTQVLLNGHLIDDTGLPMEQREKLRERRVKAQFWGTEVSPPQPAAPDKPAAANPAAAPGTAAPAGTGAQAAEGMRRALEAQRLADKLAEDLKTASRPKR